MARTGRPSEGAAAEILDQLAERDAEGLLDQAAVLDVAGELEGQGAARPAHAIVLVGRTALGEDEGNGGKAQHVVDDGGLAEQALERRDRRLRPHHAALALEAFEHRGFLAADIGAGPAADFEMEGFVRTLNIGPEPARRVGGGDRPLSWWRWRPGYSERI